MTPQAERLSSMHSHIVELIRPWSTRRPTNHDEAFEKSRDPEMGTPIAFTCTPAVGASRGRNGLPDFMFGVRASGDESVWFGVPGILMPPRLSPMFFLTFF